MDDDVPQLPVRRRTRMPGDLDWMLKGIKAGKPYIEVNAALNEVDARAAERDAQQAYNRDRYRRRRGLLALPLLDLRRVKHAAHEHPAGATAVAGAAVVVAGVLIAAATLLPHGPHRPDRTLAQPPRPAAPAKPPTRHQPSPPSAPPNRLKAAPAADPGHHTAPVAHRPGASHPVQQKPHPPQRGRPPADPPGSPPTVASRPCGINVTVLGLRLRVDLGALRLGVLCPRSP